MSRGLFGSNPVRVLLALLVPTSQAAFAQQAGVNLTYVSLDAPTTANPVPTLSEWGLLVTVLLLGVVAYRVLRTRMGGRPLASLMLAGALGLGLASGIPMAQPARAAVQTSLQILLTSASGGLVTVALDMTSAMPEYQIEVTNNTNVRQKITGIEPFGAEGYAVSGGSGTLPICRVGTTVLAPGEKCRFGLEGD